MGLKIAQFYGDKRNNGDYDNGVWMDLLKIPYIERIEQAGDYDVVIRTMWLDAIGWSREIRKRFPNVIQIGLSDHPLSTHVSKLPPERQIAYIQDLSFLDGIMALTDEERQFYDLAVPNIPVIKGGLPFPFEAYEERFGKFKNNPNKRFIGLGVGASDNDRNFISSALVMDRIHDVFPDLEGIYLSLPSYQIAPTAIYADYYGGILLHEREGMEGFYQRLSQCHFIINMADRNSPGRIQGEGAYFGVPVIGSDRLELQKELWPDLTVSPYSVEDAAKLAVFLKESPEIGAGLAVKARERLEAYNYRRSRGKFNKLLREVLAKRKVEGV
jgi:hypothetical protein